MLLNNLRLAGLASLICLAAPVAMANDIRPGCYERIYSASHLAAHPEQHVAEIRMKVGEWITNVSRDTRMEVVLADQGHVRGTREAGHTMVQFLYCGTEDRWDTCVVECDGGALQVTKQTGDAMVFRTRYLMVGDLNSCGGYVDLAERPNQWVSYKLNRAPASACNGM